MKSSGHILVVDDMPEIRELLKDILELSGYQVSTASNGKEALDALQVAPVPCMIILDLMMPVMSGEEFLKVRGDDPKLAQIPIVITTAASDPSIKNIKANAILKKPIAFETLMKSVEQYCGQTTLTPSSSNS